MHSRIISIKFYFFNSNETQSRVREAIVLLDPDQSPYTGSGSWFSYWIRILVSILEPDTIFSRNSIHPDSQSPLNYIYDF